MITYAQFTADYPEFASATQSQFTLFQNRAAQYLATPAWGAAADNSTDPSQYTQYDFAMELIIAHFLARAKMRAIATANGGAPLAKGVISAESAGGAGSVNYDTSSATEENAGHWNETDYGREFGQMARLAGAAPTTVTPGPSCDPLNGPAWTGNWPVPGYFSS